MRWIYLFGMIMGILVLSLVFNNSDNKITGSFIEIDRSVPLITGFAGVPPPDSNVMCGNESQCFVYNATCPVDTTQLFSVGNEVCDGLGGAHVAEWNNGNFSYKICCKNILTTLPGTGNPIFYHETSEGIETYGSHVYNSTSETREVIELGNDVTIRNGSNCEPEEYCILKTGNPLDNSHVWDCSYDPAGTSTTSLCYIQNGFASDCSEVVDYEENCTDPEEWTGGAGPGGDLMYCSYGEHQNMTIGTCCSEGQYAIYDELFNTHTCVDSSDLICGFNSSNPDHECGLGNYGPNDLPTNYLDDVYFSTPGCVNFAELKNCCFNATKYHTQGNFYCNINQTTYP